MASPATALFANVDTTMPGHEEGPRDLGTFGYGGDPRIDYAEWPVRGGDGRFVPQIEKFLDYGRPPSSSSSVELSTVPITWQFQIPEFPDANPRLLMPGMPVFGITERTPADLEVTIVLSLAQINQLSRQQWDDFVIWTTGDRDDNPHFNYDMRRFLTSMHIYGERGLRDYHYALQNAKHDGAARMLLNEYDTQSRIPASTWQEDIDLGKAAAPLTLREYYERSTQPGYCYLTLFGFLQRLRFLGFIQAVSKGVSLEDCMQDGEHVFTLAVAVAKQVEVTNCFGTDEEIALGSKLWIELTRAPCREQRSGVQYGPFQLTPRGSKLNDFPRARDVSYQDESGNACMGYHWKVGVVIEPPTRAIGQASITQATNTGMFSNPELAYKMNALLPVMKVAVGYKQ